MQVLQDSAEEEEVKKGSVDNVWTKMLLSNIHENKWVGSVLATVFLNLQVCWFEHEGETLLSTEQI